jgi:hypothetical protein
LKPNIAIQNHLAEEVIRDWRSEVRIGFALKLYITIQNHLAEEEISDQRLELVLFVKRELNRIP